MRSFFKPLILVCILILKDTKTHNNNLQYNVSDFDEKLCEFVVAAYTTDGFYKQPSKKGNFATKDTPFRHKININDILSWFICV